MKKQLINIALFFVMACFTTCTEDLPPTFVEFIHNSGRSWKVSSLRVNGAPTDSTLFENVNYVFDLDNDGNPTDYFATGISGTLLDGTGWKPDYYSANHEGTWRVQAASALIFEASSGEISKVTVLEARQEGYLKLTWVLPEAFSKTFPEIEIVLEIIP